jgi:hypothetical protein
MRRLLVLTSLIELATGLALLVYPSAPSSLLLGAPLEMPAAMTVARIGGVALVAIAIVCWRARDGARNQSAAVVMGLLVYNLGVIAILAHAGLALGLSGILLWPGVALHTGLAGWCVACIRKR